MYLFSSYYEKLYVVPFKLIKQEHSQKGMRLLTS